ncbi:MULTISPECIES: VWA domain-containing protein [Acidianus]|uniref:von Willebrand factor A n=1 Tax=Candidatus Acidianus copahuensis TaxID=1160895 RepID=A0A031LKX0_9CREN|nr:MULTISPECIES: VWA domain-containing protein [Acidianus]EZQ04712.1 von Willebrand factor A [Candidatus Acidianus copahuensis]NON63159.1 VWA domain-containing protein [Acidianus sp. RZ1]
MTLSLKVDVSHRYSFNSEVKMMFKILLVPEKTSTATGFHYIILLDTSGSMDGLKIEKAKAGAINMFKKIPQGNKVSFIEFSSNVSVVKEFADPQDLTEEIQKVSAEGQTAFFSALLTALKLASKYEMPSYIILLTDGNPTDMTNIDAYRKMSIPDKVQIISFGIGDDYNHDLLYMLSEKSRSVSYHLEDPNEIAESLPKAAKTKIGGKDIEVNIVAESKVNLLNYSELPVKINAAEGVIKILGDTIVPPNYSGNFITVKVNYFDPAKNRGDSLMSVISLKEANDQNTFVSGINKDIIMEYEYYSNLQKYSTDINSGNLVEATRTLKKMEELAQQTRRLELIETTRRLSSDLETTKRIGSIEQTKRLQKEVSSEVTRKLRGE